MVINVNEVPINRFFIGGELGDNKLPWVQWKKVMDKKEKCGYG